MPACLRPRRRPDRRRRPLRGRRRLPPGARAAGQPRTRSSRRGTRSAARGTCSAIPGIRSDSDMFTLGYAFKPWLAEKSIADGDTIREYIRETAREYDVERHIRFGHRVARRRLVVSETARWTVTAERDGRRARRDHRPVRLLVQRLLPLRRGLLARRSPGSSDFGGTRHPSAALAGGLRRRRQADRRHRQRRDRGDARPVAGRAGRARDDAPALPDLHRLAAGAATRWPTSCAAGCRRRRPTRSCGG